MKKDIFSFWYILSVAVAFVVIGSGFGAIFGDPAAFYYLDFAVYHLGSFSLTWLGVGQFILVLAAFYVGAWMMTAYSKHMEEQDKLEKLELAKRPKASPFDGREEGEDGVKTNEFE